LKHFSIGDISSVRTAPPGVDAFMHVPKQLRSSKLASCSTLVQKKLAGSADVVINKMYFRSQSFASLIEDFIMACASISSSKVNGLIRGRKDNEEM
jgi:hypothetical protein